ncbi:MAG: hypothetical protein QOG25_2904 [Acetobacteraceae bacterium]|nr:hypothetical protein [Acetobacteraceae bacterium]
MLGRRCSAEHAPRHRSGKGPAKKRPGANGSRRVCSSMDESVLADADRSRFRSFGTLNDIHPNGLALGKLHDIGPLESGGMDENVLSTFRGRHEAEAFGRIVPFHGTLHFHSRTGRCATARRGAEAAAGRAVSKATTGRSPCSACSGTTAAGWSRGTLVDRQYLGHLTAFLTLTNAYPQGRTRAHRGMAGLVEGIGMQERIALTVGQRHEAKPLFGIEPLDGCVMLGAETR